MYNRDIYAGNLFIMYFDQGNYEVMSYLQRKLRDLLIPPKCRMTYDLCPSLVSIVKQKTFRCESRFGVNIMAVFSDKTKQNKQNKTKH